VWVCLLACLEPSSGGLSGSLVEQLSGKPVELGPAPPKGQGSWRAGGCSCLMPSLCLFQRGGAPVVSYGAGAWQGLRGQEAEGRRSGRPTQFGSQQELKGGGLEGQVSWWVVGPAGDWCQAWPGAGIPVWCGSGTGLGSGGSCHAWVQHRAVAWLSPRGGGPGRKEQWLCRPMWQGVGRPAVLLLYRGVEKTSMI
jgi:hypothetical protein